MTTIAFSNFVRRQTKASSFSYFEGSETEVLNRTLGNFSQAKPGYRDGVILVPVSPEGFFSGTVVLEDGAKLAGMYKARRPGEMPRKQVGVVGGQKMPAKAVQIVLYRADVLAKDGDSTAQKCPNCGGQGRVVLGHCGLHDQEEPCSRCAVYGSDVKGATADCPTCKGSGRGSAADWEIVSINATATEGDEPMTPETLMANHFHVGGSNDGGTSTGMTSEEFVAALRVCFEYWKNKANVAEVPQ